MAQKTWAAGDVLTAADINLYGSHEGGAFTVWTPAVTQSGAVTVTVTEATYARTGRKIEFWGVLAVTGSGTAANDITVTLPVTAKAAYTADHRIGEGDITDTSATSIYHGFLANSSTTTFKFRDLGTTGLNLYLGGSGSSFALGLANGDKLAFHGSYEAAT